MEPSLLVVLAGGTGTRLRTRRGTKPLTRIGGLSLVERAMSSAKSAGFDEVVVVTGHRADAVEAHVLDASRRVGMPTRVVRNERYLEGNGLSALAARDVVGQRAFALVMADHVFAPELVRRLRRTRVAPGTVAVVTDPTFGAMAGVDSADAMKVAVDGDLVTAIAKDLSRYDAFDVGAFVCTDALFEAVEKAAADGDTTLAAAVGVMARAATATALPLEGGEWWFDVDTPLDLRRGRRHLLRSTGKPLDGAVATRLNRLVSQRLTTPLLLTVFPRMTPNQVTFLAFAAAVGAAASFATGRMIAAAALITVASVLDGSDGEVARLTHRGSSYGGFLDRVLDRASDGVMIVATGAYLATTPDLSGLFGEAQVPVAMLAAGTSAVAHLLVSYTTASGKVDLDHRYRGGVVGGGKGRDLRLLVLTAGALGAVIHPVSLLAAIVGIAALCTAIVVIRLRASWWAAGAGAPYGGVRAVALDFDGTVADSMAGLTTEAVRLLTTNLGLSPEDALERYCETAGVDFRTQLDLIAPGERRLARVAASFEAAKTDVMASSPVFADVARAVARLRADGVPVLLCSSTRGDVVRRYCSEHGLDGFAALDGWSDGRPKAVQLVDWARVLGVRLDEILFVGDTRHDARVARDVGARFVGIARPGRRDLLAGSGAPVVASLDDVASSVARATRSPVEVQHAMPAPMASSRTATRDVPRAVRSHDAPTVVVELAPTGPGREGRDGSEMAHLSHPRP